MSTRRNKMTILIIATVAIVAIIAGLGLKPKGFLNSKADLPQAVSINTADQPTLGNKKAALHIVAFEDLKCSNCKHYTNQLFPKIKAQYIDTEKAQYSVILLAFIDGSIPAANAALCLREQNPQYFFPYIEYLYQNQPPETEDWTTAPNLLIAANKATPQANGEQLSQCIFENKYTDTLHKNLVEAGKAMNQEISTPSVYVNGVLVRPLTMEQLAKVVESVQ